MKKKLLITIVIIAAAFMAFYYFYIYSIDVKKAKLIIAKHLNNIHNIGFTGKSDDFLICWARAIRWKFLDTFTFMQHEYNVSDGESTEATKIVETINDNSTLDSKQAKVKQQRENALINQN